MTHDLLELAQDLSDASTRQSNGFYTPDLPSLGFSAAAALRAAHEEFEYFNSFRDELQAANTKLTLENRELRAELDKASNKPRCVKCGGTDIHTSYHKQKHDLHFENAECGYSVHNRDNNEHLHRTCKTCRYDWCEQTLSAIESAMKEVGR